MYQSLLSLPASLSAVWQSLRLPLLIYLRKSFCFALLLGLLTLDSQVPHKKTRWLLLLLKPTGRG